MPRGLSTDTMPWQTVQLMLARPSGSFAASYFGSSQRESSNAPEKNGTGSWQPAQKLASLTLPSRANARSRVSRTLAA